MSHFTRPNLDYTTYMRSYITLLGNYMLELSNEYAVFVKKGFSGKVLSSTKGSVEVMRIF